MSIQITKISSGLFVELSIAEQQFLSGGRDVNAGPIYNRLDAKDKCPRTCGSVGATWNGQWDSNIPNQSSVCGCV
ncbi:Mannan-binding protein [Cylindrospermum stagnale PCC 7417]|uniref:Mannan-binding protein n=2 Tax=Cylindrospermum stagnale TaxID=142864 RepID=K9X2M7_9NOST|nr:Mannan-binding protein [Cylindrospermum stagnale PCC 7417]